MQPSIHNQWQGIIKVNDGNIVSEVRLEIAPNVSVLVTVSTAPDEAHGRNEPRARCR
jgi:molybdopterin-binding protein